jgi:hypothetical protein
VIILNFTFCLGMINWTAVESVTQRPTKAVKAARFEDTLISIFPKKMFKKGEKAM